MAVLSTKGKYAHVEWLDLEGKGTLTECAIMRKDNIGNTWFFPLTAIDRIDKMRIARIIQNRNAHLYELWDLMSTMPLNNGINSLDYFHQFVKMITPNGQIINVGQGKMGAPDMKQTMVQSSAASAASEKSSTVTKAPAAKIPA